MGTDCATGAMLTELLSGRRGSRQMKGSWCAHRGIDQGRRLQVCLRDENVAKRGRSRKRNARQRSAVEYPSNCAESRVVPSVVTGCRAVIIWSVDGACRKVHLFYGPGQSRETCWARFLDVVSVQARQVRRAQARARDLPASSCLSQESHREAHKFRLPS